jgi:hypothetical protein
MPASGIHVRGLDQLNRALRRASRDVRLGIRKELREIAEPVRADAEALAFTEISGIRKAATRTHHRGRGRPKRWERMRTGLALANNVIYVAPVQRGVRGADPRGRPNLADLLMGKAMEPALERHKGEIEARVGAALDTIAARWNA